jgi:hypothetical protein
MHSGSVTKNNLCEPKCVQYLVYLFTCILLNDTASCYDFIAPNDRMINE